MSKMSVIILCVLAALLISSQVYLGLQMLRHKESLEALISRLDVQEENVHARLDMLDAEVRSLTEAQDQNAAKIHEELDVLSGKADSLSSQINGMRRTYDALYEEQKKKTLDTTSQDTAIAQIKKDAEAYFSQKNYAAAYREFVKVLSYQKDDMDSLLKKMKSLYYKNRADSSKYSEILEDIRILKANGHCDKEATEIERIILAEREGLND
ncbi:MAG: hypothetical protein J6Y69_08800 [Treponema sp.]|nr:hypothetical protein [Treponema sp.]